MSIKRLFITASAVNASSAAFNLLGTVLLVRWFGAGVYADYLVDLAYLSLILILLEVVPSNHSVFRVQDEPTRIRGLAALAVVSAFVLVGILQISGQFFDLFHARSAWIAPYAGLMAVKRYLDIRLQSTGRLREYFGIDLQCAVVRIVLMSVFYWWAVQPVDAVWASLACATLLAQITWFVGKPDERKIFTSVVDRSAWIPLIEERRAYVPYYLGIAVKRLRDNLVPMLASIFFISREALGVFFLAYRGLVFTVGQIRIIEGLLNHRHTLATVMGLPLFHRVLVAFVGQAVCVVASLGLIVASGVEGIQMLTVLLLSFIVWLNVFSVLERAKAYSSYETLRINSAMVTYCTVAIGLVWLLITLGVRNESAFSLILIGAEGMSLSMMYLFVRYKK